MNVREESLKKHGEWKGKIEIVSRVEVNDREKLSLAYTPGVAEPCMAIHHDIEKSFELTRRWNTVPVITEAASRMAAFTFWVTTEMAKKPLHRV